MLHQTRSLLAFHLELGMEGLPSSPDLHAFLVNNKQPADVSPPNRAPAVHKPAPAAGGARQSVAGHLETIARDLAGCNHCAPESGNAAAGKGSAAPRLFVVGDFCRSAAEGVDVVWDRAEDELFWKMMAAIGLDSETVYVTNCIKCDRNEASPKDVEAGRRCFTFLERELAAMEPALICTMGELATSQLLGSQTPLVRMRGRFHTYRYPHGGTARVMPTFHPAFLLRNPEMKRAAWMDLQALQRQLQAAA